MRKPFTLFQKILLSLIIAMLLVVLSDLLLQYFFDIRLSCGELIMPLGIVGIVSLYVFFSRKKLFVFVLLSVVSSLMLIFYSFTKDDIGRRSAISGSVYSIKTCPHSYSIIKHYSFAEKVIATKNSDAFFDPDSKTAIVIGHQVKVLRETADSLVIEIQSPNYSLDSLKKQSLWSPKFRKDLWD